MSRKRVRVLAEVKPLNDQEAGRLELDVLSPGFPTLAGALIRGLDLEQDFGGYWPMPGTWQITFEGPLTDAAQERAWLRIDAEQRENS